MTKRFNSSFILVLLVAVHLISINAFSQGSRNALDFDGIDDYMSVSSHSSLNITDDFTFETWVKSDDDTKDLQSLFEYYWNQSDNGALIFLSGTNGPAGVSWGSRKIVANFNTGNGNHHIYYTQANDVWTANEWTHVAVTREGDQVAFYVNGIYYPAQLDNSGDTTSTAIGNADQLYASSDAYLGAHAVGTAYHLDGQLDEPSVWAAALDSTIIRQWMCRKVNNTHPNWTDLTAFWRMNASSGTNVNDNSSNTNAGTLFNMNNSDWVRSGAPLGDTSVVDYNAPGFLSHPHPDGDVFSIFSFTGGAEGYHIYRVDQAPNTENDLVPLCGNDRYFGVFLAGGSNPSYDAQYDYASHPLITTLNEQQLDLWKRDDNADLSWQDLSGTVNTLTDNVSASGLNGMSEFILGRNSHSTIVSTNQDTGCGSLRVAIDIANSGDTVFFEPSVNGNPINLSIFGELSIDKNLTILGNGFIFTEINGVNTHRIFSIGAGDTVNVIGVALKDGFSASSGGAINSAGVLTLTNSLLQANSATNHGGAIYVSSGHLNLNNSIIIENEAANGAGLSLAPNTNLNASNVTFKDNVASNFGGGIRTFGNSSSILSSTDFVENEALDGAGVFNEGQFTITNAEFSKNIASGAGAGIYNGSILAINQCSLDSNIAVSPGGAIYNYGLLDIQNSTFRRNQSTSASGGALQLVSSGEADIKNSTFSGNTASVFGGAINQEGGNNKINSSTITLNRAISGGGIRNSASTLTIANCIIANNTAISGSPKPDFDNTGSFANSGYNIVGDTTGSNWQVVTGDIVGNTSNPVGADLLPLANNGGPTLTHAFNCSALPNNAGTNSFTPNTDQRGLPVVGTRDIGAYEAQFIIPTPNLGADQEVCSEDNALLSVGTAADSVNWYDYQGNLIAEDTTAYGYQVTYDDTLIVEMFTTDGGDCGVFDTLIVNEWIPVQPTFTMNAGWLEASGALAYQWLLDGNAIPSAVTDSLFPTQSGYYSVLGLDANGCWGESDSLFVSITDIEEIANVDLEIYPNPTSGLFTIQAQNLNDNIRISLIDMLGREVYSTRVKRLSGQQIIDVSELSAGKYILQVIGDKILINSRLVISK